MANRVAATGAKGTSGFARGGGLLSAAGGILLLLVLTLPKLKEPPPGDPNETPKTALLHSRPGVWTASSPLPRSKAGLPAKSPEEVVRDKLTLFVAKRRDLIHHMAEILKVNLPPEVDRFFDAAQDGRWGEQRAMFEALRAQRADHPELNALWGAISESYGVSEAVHDWSAPALLGYGEAILGSLKPGSVYLGGTDAGRFIPTLLNETSGGERFVVLTQNALADNSYTDYVRFLYAEGINNLEPADADRAFADYIADARKRFEHDRDFPNEPKQLRPGEDVQVEANRIQVSGQIAVMSINEKLTKALMEKNPQLSFALEESFPFQSMYGTASPLGPILELQAGSEMNPEAADKTVEFWRSAESELNLNSSGTSAQDSQARSAWAKMALAQAHLLTANNFTPQAEELFHTALELAPSNPEVVMDYVNLLVQNGRGSEAIPVLENSMRLAPQDQRFGALLDQLHSKGLR